MCINYIVTRTHYTTWPLFSHLTGRGRPSEMVRLCGCSDDNTWLMDFYWIHRKPRHWSLAPGHKLQSSTAWQASVLWTPPLRYQQPSVCAWYYHWLSFDIWRSHHQSGQLVQLPHTKLASYSSPYWLWHCKYHRMLSSCHQTGLL